MKTVFCLCLCIVNVFIFDVSYVDGFEKQRVDPKKCLVWGHGLSTPFTVPARFFFIQAVDVNGQNVTESEGDNMFQVHIYKNGNNPRIWTQTLNRHDGSFIVRYKLYESYKNLKIHILYKNKHVAKSPYLLDGNVYHETCNCPVPRIETWIKHMNCPKSYSQIKNDLSRFPAIDMNALRQEYIQRFNNRGRHSLCHYVVKDNKIYRKTYGEHVGFKMFMDAMLLSLTRKVKLPDFEFFMNLGDWPLETKKKDGLPVFSWCGSEETTDIVLPTYDLTESTLETMGRVTLDLLSVQANTGPKWNNKTDKAIWRGRDSRQERLELVRLSRKHPDDIDARLTNMFFFKHVKEEFGELVPHMSFFDFFKFKYQLNIDGTVAAYRFPYLLSGDSLVFKQDSGYYEHFYKRLKPWKHYIPLKKDFSDLLENINWARVNSDKAQEIVKNAQAFVRENLMSNDIFCYHTVLFREYARRLINEVKVMEGMEEVKQPSEEPCDCHYEKSQTNSKEGHVEL